MAIAEGPSFARPGRTNASAPTRPDPYAGCALRIIFFQLILFQSIFVRTRERSSMNRKISSNPLEAVGMVWARLGRMEKRP